jgi:TRAP-type transport system periplasmic protein
MPTDWDNISISNTIIDKGRLKEVKMKTISWLTCGVIFILLLAMLIPSCASQPSAPSSAPSSAPAQTSAPAPVSTTAKPPATSAASAPGSTSVQSIKLKCAYTTPPNSSVGIYFKWLGDEMDKRTGGKVKFEIYPGAALFKGTEAYDALKGRVADIIQLQPGVFPSDFQLSMLYGLPGLNFPDTVESYIAADKAFQKLMEENSELKAEYSKIKLICTIGQASFGLLSKKEIRVPEDMNGQKIGGALTSRLPLIEKYGGAGVDIIPPAIYENMDRKVISGAFSSWTYVKDYKLWEVGGYFLDVQAGSTLMGVAMNNDAWNGLPPDIQKILVDASLEGTKISYDDTIKNLKIGQEQFVKAGGKVTNIKPDELAKWNKAYENTVWNSWIDDTTKSGKKSAKDAFNRWVQLKAEYLKK